VDKSIEALVRVHRTRPGPTSWYDLLDDKTKKRVNEYVEFYLSRREYKATEVVKAMNQELGLSVRQDAFRLLARKGK
jgi:hypothetical protein